MTPNLRRLIMVALVLVVLVVADQIWRALNPDVATPVSPPVASRPAIATSPMIAKAQPVPTSVAVRPGAAPASPQSSGLPASGARGWPSMRPLSDYKAAFSAPLFSPRRAKDLPLPPASVGPVQVVKPPDPLDAARLVGVARGGENAIAIINSGGRILRLESGDLFGDWVVDDIKSSSVVFSREGETRELSQAR